MYERCRRPMRTTSRALTILLVRPVVLCGGQLELTMCGYFLACYLLWRGESTRDVHWRGARPPSQSTTSAPTSPTSGPTIPKYGQVRYGDHTLSSPFCLVSDEPSSGVEDREYASCILNGGVRLLTVPSSGRAAPSVLQALRAKSRTRSE